MRFPSRRLTLGVLAIGCLSVLAACSSSSRDAEDENAEGALQRRLDAAWFYDGPLPAISDAQVTVSLKGHTVRVHGTVPASTDLSGLPHVQSAPDGDRLVVDVVYPIATARPGKSNSPPGTYGFQMVKPYRPDGTAITVEEGEHWVTWGGYPFVAYNGGIAFHGPISYSGESTAELSDDIWYLRRGPVSGGCNRMAAEHIIEFTHVIGVSMRKVYVANKMYNPNTPAKIEVLGDYDKIGDKYVDVDYPTDAGAKRPSAEYGAENVNMFGSWVATETPDGRDLPPDMKWEGGVSGKYYKFREHAREGFVCAVEANELPAVKEQASRSPNGELPRGFCNGRVRPPVAGGVVANPGANPSAEQKPPR